MFSGFQVLEQKRIQETIIKLIIELVTKTNKKDSKQRFD
jgi:hypothetical protein